jgi:DNA-binding NtrC family response regulator
MNGSMTPDTPRQPSPHAIQADDVTTTPDAAVPPRAATSPSQNLHARLLDALVHAVAAFSGGDARAALHASFDALVEAVRAERALLVRVSPKGHPGEALAVKGLSDAEVEALLEGRPVTGLVSALLHTAARSGMSASASAAPWALPEAEAASVLHDSRESVVCLPVRDHHTGLPMAVLYVQTSPADGPLTTDMLPALGAYAIALSHAWPGWGAGPRVTGRGRLTARLEIVGDSDSIRGLRSRIERVVLPAMAAPQPDPILILGPTGTGKELVARHLHARSVRAHAPFIAANCAAFAGDVLETTLFGHVRGAFTGAVGASDGLFVAADRGVLFLDELGDMPLQGQSMLLRALESRSVRALGARDERAVDVQLICATNRDLRAAMQAGRFREDLFYRINGVTLRLVSLQDRPEDIGPLLSYYLGVHQKRLGRHGVRLNPEALSLLQNYAWPGNVRELSHVCALLVLHAHAGIPIEPALVEELVPEIRAGKALAVAPDDWPWPEVDMAASEHALVNPVLEERGVVQPAATALESVIARALPVQGTLQEAVAAFERAYLRELGEATGWNKTSMAAALGVDRKTLYVRLRRYGLMAGGAGDAAGPGDGE